MSEYCLYDTATETLEAYQLMDVGEAEERNNDLRADGDSRRWIPVVEEGAASDNGRHCPYYGREVPANWTGCAECKIARECYEEYERSLAAVSEG